MKPYQLIKLAIQYSLISEANLRSDMAKRIMYSIIPSLSNTTQIMGTQGVVDYNALKAAIEGRKDIIKYGARACAKELGHYGGPSKPYGLQVLIDTRKYEELFKIAIKLFGQEENWEPHFGGKAWFNIAKTLNKINDFDRSLDELRSNRNKEPNFAEKEIIIMRELVVALNVFDGLSHNTESIMSNMVKEESLELHPEQTYDQIMEEFEAIQKLQDAKEINDPLSVFKEIEKDLINSGDINRYKDWVSKIHRDPSYREENDNLNLEKKSIRLRKILNNHFLQIDSRINFLEAEKETLLRINSNNMQVDDFSTIEQTYYDVCGSYNETGYFFNNYINIIINDIKHVNTHNPAEHLHKMQSYLLDMRNKFLQKMELFSANMKILKSNKTIEDLSSTYQIRFYKELISYLAESISSLKILNYYLKDI